MNTSIEALVDKIFEHLRRGGSVLANTRRPGLSRSYIELSVHALGLEPPEDFVRLYSCCDGTAIIDGDTLGAIQFVPMGFHWMTLETSIAIYRSMFTYSEWRKSWFPCFANGGGDFYAVICDRSSPHHGEVVGFVMGEPEQSVEYHSISSMLEVMEHSFAKGAIYFKNGRISVNVSQMRVIAGELQPGFTEHLV